MPTSAMGALALVFGIIGLLAGAFLLVALLYSFRDTLASLARVLFWK